MIQQYLIKLVSKIVSSMAFLWCLVGRGITGTLGLLKALYCFVVLFFSLAFKLTRESISVCRVCKNNYAYKLNRTSIKLNSKVRNNYKQYLMKLLCMFAIKLRGNIFKVRVFFKKESISRLIERLKKLILVRNKIIKYINEIKNMFINIMYALRKLIQEFDHKFYLLIINLSFIQKQHASI